jgi:hypothetical protein
MSLNFYGEHVLTSPQAGFQVSQDQKEPYQYIIHQNEVLHAEVERLNKEVAKLKNEKDILEKEKEEQEDEMDSHEKSKTVMKGYLRNEIEIVKYSSDLIKYYELKIDLFLETGQKHRRQGVVEISGLSFYLLSANTIFYLGYQNFYVYTLHYCIFSILFFRVSKLIKTFLTAQNDFLTIQSNSFVLAKKNKIKETEKGNDYIGDLIDSL